MQRLIIEGGGKIEGELRTQGAKNSVLPILAATILANGVSVIHNCPRLSDVDSAVRILTFLGCRVTREGDTITVDARSIERFDIPENMMREMRSSVIFLGAVLSRQGKAVMSYPGGCELGPRPIDLHIQSLRCLGADIDDQHGQVVCQAQRAKGNTISLSVPSVGATENIMLYAARSAGTTLIVNAAREPEIEDLQDFLNAMGARISGAGGTIIRIDGVPRLFGAEHTVIPDRIAAATFLCCAAATGGKLTVTNVRPRHIDAVTALLAESGCTLSCGENTVTLRRTGLLKPCRMIRTMPYPGFPTDAQAIMMAYLLLAQGTSVFVETIFENRFRHVDELRAMGADVIVSDRTAVVQGCTRLTGASVCATDLRGGAALVVAALAADGRTTIGDIEHIDRGYENIESILSSLGAKIKRA